MTAANAASQPIGDLRERLRALPPGSLVPAAWVLEMLGDAAKGSSRAPGPAMDLNVVDLAMLFKKRPSTVRAWIERGDFPGAYKLNGKEWRVPAGAVEAFQKAQQRVADAGDGLSAWRDVSRP